MMTMKKKKEKLTTRSTDRRDIFLLPSIAPPSGAFFSVLRLLPLLVVACCCSSSSSSSLPLASAFHHLPLSSHQRSNVVGRTVGGPSHHYYNHNSASNHKLIGRNNKKWPTTASGGCVGITTTATRSTTRLLQKPRRDDEEDSEQEEESFQVDQLVGETSLALRRLSWFSWWSQVILSTVSGVILFFVRNVVGRNRNSGGLIEPNASFLLSGCGLIVSMVSIVWTWGNGARLSRRMIRKPTTQIQAATLLRRAIKIGVTLNLVGLLLNMIAAEQIVGILAIKVLTQPGFANPSSYAMAGAGGGALLQPLDILVVQANTNSLLSNFISLACLLFLTDKLMKLDPPSTE